MVETPRGECSQRVTEAVLKYLSLRSESQVVVFQHSFTLAFKATSESVTVFFFLQVGSAWLKLLDSFWLAFNFKYGRERMLFGESFKLFPLMEKTCFSAC